jgi:hypothetical protein
MRPRSVHRATFRAAFRITSRFFGSISLAVSPTISTAGPAAGQAGLDCMGAMVTGNSPTSSCDIPSVTGSWTGVEGPEPVSPRILTAIAMAT